MPALSHQLQPRFTEFQISHINNRVPPAWFEDCRWELIRKTTELMGKDKQFGLVRQATYTYNRELHLDAEVTIKTWVHKLGTSSVVTHQEAWQKGELAVTGEVILVAIDEVKRAKTPITEQARSYLQQFTV